MSQKIGTIKEIWQYPVKSMQGNKISKALLWQGSYYSYGKTTDFIMLCYTNRWFDYWLV